MSTHAQLSPSSAARWMACPGSVAMCQGMPDESSKFADEGTDAHEIAAFCLELGGDAAGSLGRTLSKGHVVTDEMALAVQDYINYVRGVVAATGGELLVEQRLPISSITGEPDAHGTSDAVILTTDELIVVDLKYGRGVPVDAEDNPQLQIYALAALREFSLAQDFKTVRMVIHQPRLGAVSEWVQTVEELEAFGKKVEDAAAHATGCVQFGVDEVEDLNPGEKQCRFCKAKATCGALRDEVQSVTMADFDNEVDPVTPADPAIVGVCMKYVGLVEDWCKAVRAEAERNLLAGVPVPGWKLVQGKKGNRQWTNKEEAEETLKAMRVKHDQMYDYSVISPTSAEKLAKAEVIGPRQWPKLQALITQADGKPSVAPESDKRPALVLSATADDFQDVSGEALS